MSERLKKDRELTPRESLGLFSDAKKLLKRLPQFENETGGSITDHYDVRALADRGMASVLARLESEKYHFAGVDHSVIRIIREEWAEYDSDSPWVVRRLTYSLDRHRYSQHHVIVHSHKAVETGMTAPDQTLEGVILPERLRSGQPVLTSTLDASSRLTIADAASIEQLLSFVSAQIEQQSGRLAPVIPLRKVGYIGLTLARDDES